METGEWPSQEAALPAHRTPPRARGLTAHSLSHIHSVSEGPHENTHRSVLTSLLKFVASYKYMINTGTGRPGTHTHGL